MNPEDLRKQILDLVREYARLAHAPKPFRASETPVPISGRVYGAEDMCSLADAALDFWLTSGRFNDRFEKKLSDFLGLPHVLTTNSGSSANLLALAALCSPRLGARALEPGDEVITAAACFPTTVNPLLLYGLLPVFVDVTLPTYNVCPRAVEAAITKKTRAVVLAHTLGNPIDLDPLLALVRKHNLWFIEDCCDALGSTYRAKKVGTFGHIGTLSCYTAHHITMGEGGAVFTADPELKGILQSLRDWGRDCYCKTGKDNTCGKRFGWQLGELPMGYDHKYIYSELGYNLKITDMQAAVGCAQLDRLEAFIDARKKNFAKLRESLEPYEEFLILPQATRESDPAWFGFPLTVRPQAPFGREHLVRHLNAKRVATRPLFAGNILRQPYFAGRKYRVSGALQTTDLVMANTFWVGVYPGVSEDMIAYVATCIGEFVRKETACGQLP